MQLRLIKKQVHARIAVAEKTCIKNQKMDLNYKKSETKIMHSVLK